MQLCWQTLRELDEAYGEAFFLLDLEAFRRNVHEMRAAFQAIYPRSAIAYSYKTNYTPLICGAADRLGCYAEVVSALEYQLARRLGVAAQRIIFNGPYKPPADLEQALLDGALVNLDGCHELELVEAIARRYPQQRLQIGLRCNFVLEGEPISRFGFDVAGGALVDALGRLRRLTNCRIVGLHCHYSTGRRSLASYAERTRRLLELTRCCLAADQPQLINIGGGFFGKLAAELRAQFDCAIPSYQEYAAVIAPLLREAYPDAGPELVVEPGTALVADVMRFVARVVTVKHVRGRRLALVAGSIQTLKPTLHQKRLPLTVFHSPHTPVAAGADGPLDIVGYTCMEHDCLLPAYAGPLHPGDYVVFEGVGAYTVVMKPPFIQPAPAVLAYDAASPLLVARRAECLDDLFASYNYATLYTESLP